MMMRQWMVVFACALAASANAQTYPDKVIRLVVPFAAGGTSDVMVRPLTEKLTTALGQSVVADYTPGGGGAAAAAKVAAAAPDGYVIFLGSTSSLTTGPYVNPVKYDPVKSFTPIGQIARSEYILVVPASSPFKSVADVVAAAKQKPGTLTFGTPGVGSVGHLAGELLKSRDGIDIHHVPYRGQGPMDIDLFGGRLDMAIAGLGNMVAAVQNGRLRALAVTGAVRSTTLPDVPTMSEAGVPDFDASVFWGIVAPAGTPAEVVNKVNAALRTMVAMPDVRKFWISQGQDPVVGSPTELGALIEHEYTRWKSIVTAAHIGQQ